MAHQKENGTSTILDQILKIILCKMSSPFKSRILYPKDSIEKLKISKNNIYLFDREAYEDFLKKLYLENNKENQSLSKQLLDLWKIVIQGRIFDINGIFLQDDRYYGPEDLKSANMKILSEIGNLLTDLSRGKWDPNELSEKFTYGLKSLIEKKEIINEGLQKIEHFEKSLLGVFFYMNYLQKVNNNVCVPITDTEGLIKGLENLIRNLEQLSKEEFINKYFILYNSYDQIIENKTENSINEFIFDLLNKILLWMSPFLIITKSSFSNKNILQVSNTFRTLFQKCNQSSSKFIAIPFLFYLQDCRHANILIADTKNKTIERFEPHGSIIYSSRFSCPQSFADQELAELFSEYGYQYLSPKEICPLIGPQEEYETQKRMRQEEGFCVTWSIIYANLRLENLSENKEIVKNMTNDLTKYIMNLFGDRKVEMKSYELINLYFQHRLKILMKYFQENLDKINNTFETTFQLDERILNF
jgi:hypothetical protein